MIPVLAVIAAAVLFGTTGTAQALGPEGTTPLSVGVMRLVVGGTALAAIGLALARRRTHGPAARANPALTRRALGLMAVTGVCLAAYQPLFFLGTERNGVAVATVMALGSAPVLAGLLEWGLTRRVPGRIWMLATLLATIGVILLAFGGGAGTAGGTDPIGIVGSVGAGASFAVFANAQRRLMDDGWDPFTVAGAMGAGSAIVGALALPFVDLAWVAEPTGLTMALWLGLATIAVAYTLFTWGLERLTAATAATLTLAEPLTAGILGVAVLGERLSLLAVAGLLVLASGLVILALGSRKPRDPVPFAVEA
ncbi:DMT family transporter [Microbacterium sp. RU33B]|uniref:DMT family transporter n=1 Tax=Microbacterium sp. RU33B TaxID=1907390 RepID=UPI00096447A9|nr:EamA family transporter [Microbacterium sp. RU33B]SIT69966.1 drug/metabolite transporter, DME family [Microbacterium sp. RU33B]